MKGPDPGKWGVLGVVCIAVFIMVIDTTIMNVSITALVKDLNTDVASVQLAITVYALVMASLMLLGSKLQDIIGLKKVFIIGTIIYGIGTFIASISQNIFTLTLGWSVLEGIAAALMLPATASFLLSNYNGKERAFAFGIWGGIAAAAMAFGPIVGGFLTTFYSWRWAFRLELLLVITILIFSYILIERKPRLSWRDLDIIGFILSGSGLTLVVIGILSSRNPQLWMFIPFVIGAGLVILLAFLFWEHRRTKKGKEALTDITILKNRVFDLGNVISTVQSLVFAGFIFVIPVYLQSVIKIDAFSTGILLLPMSIAVFIVSVFGAKAASYISARSIMLSGSLVAMAGGFILRDLFTPTTIPTDLIPGMIVFGIGMGLILSQVNNLTLSSVAPEKQSDASGVLNATKQLGTSLGTAIIGVVLLVGIFNGLVMGTTNAGISSATEQDKIVTDLMNWMEKMKTTEIQDIPAADQASAEILVNSAVKNAMKSAFDVIIIILAMTTIVTLFLPRKIKTKPLT